ncbi:MAG: type II toxin-antitoxin system VapC family toxin [Actinomycetia bacterium]|nr:type II toxin-antitoxin system VapC family toxin [Actinomycetes bacterium]
MLLYLDSSALVKLYVNEPGSDQVHTLVQQASVVATSLIAYPEARAAVARRLREGALTADHALRIKAGLAADWGAFWVIPVRDDIARTAGDLSELYGLRGMEALHLASALWLDRQHEDRVRFAVWDRRLATGAQAAGLLVVGADP